ncbi:MAG: histidine--tRNA ligase [Myxococcota bacterium]|nr:histidine--tRNA ligase [Myxococcota bacterium]
MPRAHLPKGTRDLLPEQMNRRLKVIETVRRVFTRYGFEPLETPAFERIETLTGKYGDEGDRLIFKILKRGEGGKRGEVDLALRYDLTVPLARVMAMNPQLLLPFKRSQVQPVWRADRPQKGRFREFYQCDVDVVGNESPIAEAECLAVVHDVLSELGFRSFTIRLNDRRLLQALARAIGAQEQETSLLVALDKLDKIGRDGVNRELGERGFTPDQISRLWPLLDGDPIPGTDEAEAGLVRVVQLATALGVDPDSIRIDRTLARGLDYYTGPIFETIVNEPDIGSIAGGGRYDELIGMFSGRSIPAVGVSLGLERIFVVMEELGLMEDASTSTRVWVTVFSEDLLPASLQVTRALRSADIPTDIASAGTKLTKQLRAAHRRGIPYVVILGPTEVERGVLILRNLSSGDQEELSLEQAITRLQGA